MTTHDLTVDAGSGDSAGRLSHPLPADWLEHLGWFRFSFLDDRWAWSPQVERLHGYRPGTTAPSTLLLLSHVHLDDYQQMAATLRDVRRDHQPFTSRHRVVDTADQVHDVVLIGTPFHDTRGAVVGMHGFYVDLSQAVASAQLRRYEHTTNQLRIHATCNRFAGDRRRVRSATRC